MWTAYLLIAIFGVSSYLLKKLTLSGSIAGTFLAGLLYYAFSWAGLIILITFFVFANLATRWKRNTKRRLLGTEMEEGIRSWPNVLGNGGIAGMLAIVAALLPQYRDLCMVMATSAFATACSDTLSSELGNIYGKRFIYVLGGKGIRGNNGVISPEGTAFGFLGALLVAISIYPFVNTLQIVVIITISGFAGNLTDTFLGAILENKGIINNHQVNALATASGAILGALFYLF